MAKKKEVHTMPEVAPGIWRDEVDDMILEAIKTERGYKAARTRKSDRASELVGEYETLQEAIEAAYRKESSHGDRN